MLNENEIVNILTERLDEKLKAAYPTYSKAWLITFPAKPETITGDIIKVQHPKGLLSVRYSESEGMQAGKESLVFSVYIWATSPAMESRLTRAVKIILTGFATGGSTSLQLLKDESAIQENGVSVRVCSFTTQVAHDRYTDINQSLVNLQL